MPCRPCSPALLEVKESEINRNTILSSSGSKGLLKCRELSRAALITRVPKYTQSAQAKVHFELYTSMSV